MDTAGRHAVLAADAIADWISGRITSLTRDLSQLADA
jgi:hypothetical protein